MLSLNQFGQACRSALYFFIVIALCFELRSLLSLVPWLEIAAPTDGPTLRTVLVLATIAATLAFVTKALYWIARNVGMSSLEANRGLMAFGIGVVVFVASFFIVQTGGYYLIIQTLICGFIAYTIAALNLAAHIIGKIWENRERQDPTERALQSIQEALRAPDSTC